MGSSGVTSIHADPPSCTNVVTNTHPASSKARVSEAFMKRLTTITAITMRCARGWFSECRVGVELLGDDCRKAGVRTLAHLKLTREDEHRAVGFDLDVRTNRIRQFLWREWRNVQFRSRRKRLRMITRCQSAGSSADRFFDARVRAAAAQVAVHPHRDRCGIRCRVGFQHRDGSERLPRLTVAALDDVAAIPRVADCVHHRA